MIARLNAPVWFEACENSPVVNLWNWDGVDPNASALDPLFFAVDEHIIAVRAAAVYAKSEFAFADAEFTELAPPRLTQAPPSKAPPRVNDAWSAPLPTAFVRPTRKREAPLRKRPMAAKRLSGSAMMARACVRARRRVRRGRACRKPRVRERRPARHSANVNADAQRSGRERVPLAGCHRARGRKRAACGCDCDCGAGQGSAAV